MTATQTARPVKQTAANNPVLARIKQVANGKVYVSAISELALMGEERAARLAARGLFTASVWSEWTVYFLTGKIGDGSISAETAAAWGISA